jgi:hypothetical protein
MIGKTGMFWMMMAGAGLAQSVPVERAALATSSLTLHQHAFLTEEEITTLRFVLTSEEALCRLMRASSAEAFRSSRLLRLVICRMPVRHAQPPQRPARRQRKAASRASSSLKSPLRPDGTLLD